MMAMLQNSFVQCHCQPDASARCRGRSSIIMPPVVGELIAALVVAAVTRALLSAGPSGDHALWGRHVTPIHPLSIIWFGLMGALLLAFLGLLTSVWPTVRPCRGLTNFVVTPLSLLSVLSTRSSNCRRPSAS